jgi:hypothetical protein
MLGLFGTLSRLQESQGGPTSGLQDDDFALKGPTSPLKGPDVSIISSFLAF